MYTRLFAVINWSEYGHWVISIVMLGFAASGVLLSLFPDFFERRRRALLAWIPAVLILATLVSYWGVCATPLASLTAAGIGYTSILAATAALYALALAVFPGKRGEKA